MNKRKTLVEGIVMASFFLTLASCASQTVRMIQPETGATAECSGSSVGMAPLLAESFVDSCARVYKDRGFVPLERLTPEERAGLERRGLLPKD